MSEYTVYILIYICYMNMYTYIHIPVPAAELSTLCIIHGFIPSAMQMGARPLVAGMSWAELDLGPEQVKQI